MTRQLVGALMALGRGARYEDAPRQGRALGLACYYGMPRYRRVALSNLRLAFGKEWDERRIRATARESFVQLGTTLVEFLLHQSRFTPEDVAHWVHWDGQEHLEAAFARGQGVILITAHYGNWELLGPRLLVSGYPVHAIVRDADDPGLNTLINDIRTRWGAKMYPRRLGARRALELLRRNELLVVLLDQNVAEGGIFVEFFGRPASTATGAARLAHRTGAALVCAFSIRQADRTHRVRVLPALLPDPKAPVEDEIRRLTAALTRCIEEQIREQPEPWWWLHNRWKMQPDMVDQSAVRGGLLAAEAVERT
ncbi:MAG: lysophospholipid acyltransferase family protein [Armatimonadetes bacterium]|nr:lysophospholipid acyltransferase family protein [Armatimonadota bacterium]